MSELPPHLEALLESARSAHDPTPADAERVHAAVMATIGAGVAAATATTASATATASAKISGGIAGAAVAKTGMGVGAKILIASALLGSAATVYTLSREPAAERTAQAAPHVQVAQPAPSVPEVAAPAPAVAPKAPSAVETPPAPKSPLPWERLRERVPAPHHARVSTAPTPPEAQAALDVPAAAPAPAPQATKPAASNAAELDLIRSTLTALRDGQTGRALTLLSDHEQRFPQGMFTTERLGLRVIALCADGALEQGRREQAAFLRRHGETPLAARVRAACHGEKP
jgi:hypothetical protein